MICNVHGPPGIGVVFQHWLSETNIKPATTYS